MKLGPGDYAQHGATLNIHDRESMVLLISNYVEFEANIVQIYYLIKWGKIVEKVKDGS